MIMHFNSKKERLDFVRGKFTEIEPIEVKNEEVEEEPKTEEKPKPKAKAKPKKEVKK